MPWMPTASLIFIAAGCVAPHMIVPEALVGRSAVLDVVGKSPFRSTWQLGEYEVREAWRGGPSGTDFGFVIAAPSADPLAVRCVSVPDVESAGAVFLHDVVKPPDVPLGTRAGLTCPIGAGSFVATWNHGLAATLSIEGRALRVEVARGIEGDDLPTPSGLLFMDEARVVAAFETVGVGRLLVLEGTPPAERIAIAAASIALLRWEDIRGSARMSRRETSFDYVTAQPGPRSP